MRPTEVITEYFLKQFPHCPGEVSCYRERALCLPAQSQEISEPKKSWCLLEQWLWGRLPGRSTKLPQCNREVIVRLLLAHLWPLGSHPRMTSSPCSCGTHHSSSFVFAFPLGPHYWAFHASAHSLAFYGLAFPNDTTVSSSSHKCSAPNPSQ